MSQALRRGDMAIHFHHQCTSTISSWPTKAHPYIPQSNFTLVPSNAGCNFSKPRGVGNIAASADASKQRCAASREELAQLRQSLEALSPDVNKDAQ